MKLSIQTISAICHIITGAIQLSPYRSGPDLITFFNQFGGNDEYGYGFPSRAKYAEGKALEINGTSQTAKLVEQAVDPRHFLGTQFDVEEAVNHLNKFLEYDGYQLANVGLAYQLERIASESSDGSRVKNLIFASNGPKPELVLVDALNNDIRIVKNAEYCLIYDEIIPDDGLLWYKVVEWWANNNNVLFPSDEAEFALYNRLFDSVKSPPEQLLFSTYYKSFRRKLGDSFPALIPQVYLHYDPKTLKELQGTKRLKRQRMDFLVLLPHNRRVVLEVDGKQHYATGEVADPAKYAEMVSADRELKLTGYEIYRFGGTELQDGAGRRLVENFFEQLFLRYQII